MKFVVLATAAMLHLAAGGGADSHHEHEDEILKPDTPVDVGTTLKGSTISVLAYRTFAPQVKQPDGTSSSSDRVVFQGWLREDGVARVRVLDEGHNTWRPVANESWSVEGDLFCLSAGSFGMGKLCLDTLIYGQVFSAATPKADILVKGNWRKGNVHGL